jgi:hypothetical protein
MSDMIGVVRMALAQDETTWEVSCTRCLWGTAHLLDSGYDGYLGTENYSLVESLAQQHSDSHKQE